MMGFIVGTLVGGIIVHVAFRLGYRQGWNDGHITGWTERTIRTPTQPWPPRKVG